jgi:hypothetical protein
MRQQFLQVLGSPDSNDEMTDVVRRFWTRAKPLARPLGRVDDARIDRTILNPGTRIPTQTKLPDAQVIDLATWARSRLPAR